MAPALLLLPSSLGRGLRIEWTAVVAGFRSDLLRDVSRVAVAAAAKCGRGVRSDSAGLFRTDVSATSAFLLTVLMHYPIWLAGAFIAERLRAGGLGTLLPSPRQHSLSRRSGAACQVTGALAGIDRRADRSAAGAVISSRPARVAIDYGRGRVLRLALLHDLHRALSCADIDQRLRDHVLRGSDRARLAGRVRGDGVPSISAACASRCASGTSSIRGIGKNRRRRDRPGRGMGVLSAWRSRALRGAARASPHGQARAARDRRVDAAGRAPGWLPASVFARLGQRSTRTWRPHR